MALFLSQISRCFFGHYCHGPARDFDDASLALGRRSRPAENVTDPSSLDKFESRDSLADMLSGPLDCGVQWYYWKQS